MDKRLQILLELEGRGKLPEKYAPVLQEARSRKLVPSTNEEKQGVVAGAVDALTDGMALGFGDNLTAIEAGVLGRTPEGGWFDYSKSFRERYDDALNAERRQNEDFRKEHPILSTGANIAGAVAMPFAAAKSGATLLKGGMSAGKAMGLGAAEGAAYGAAHGAGAADGKNVLLNALMGGAAGGAVGGSLSGIGQALANRMANRGTQTFATIDDLKAAKDAAYKHVDDLDVKYKPEAIDDLLTGMKSENEAAMIDPLLHDKASRVFDRVSENIGGQPTSLTKLDQMRQFTRDNTASADANRFYGRKMVRNIDEFVNSAGPGQVQHGNAPEAAAALSEARNLHGRKARFEEIASAIDRAKARAASTNSGANTGNAIRQNIRREWERAQKPGKGFYTPSEMELMRQVFEGTTAQNAIRGTGKALGGALGKIVGMGGAAHTGNPVYATMPIIGSLARTVDEGMTTANANALLTEILRGKQTQAPQSALYNALQKLAVERAAKELAY